MTPTRNIFIGLLIVVLLPLTCIAQERADSEVEKAISALLSHRDDTIRILGFSNPSNCIKCDVGVSNLIESIRSCISSNTIPMRTGFFVSVSRASDLRPLRRLYPASTLLIADVGAKLSATLRLDEQPRCFVIYKNRAWSVTSKDAYCNWIRSIL